MDKLLGLRLFLRNLMDEERLTGIEARLGMLVLRELPFLITWT